MGPMHVTHAGAQGDAVHDAVGVAVTSFSDPPQDAYDSTTV